MSEISDKLQERNDIYHLLKEKLEPIFALQNSGKNLLKFNDYFEYKYPFKKQGKQAVVGLIKLKEIDHPIIFKYSPHSDYTTIHESLIFQDVNTINHPNFSRSFGLIPLRINNDILSKDIFDDSSKMIYDVLLVEYVKGKKLHDLITERKLKKKIMYSIIRQILLAIIVAQESVKLTHYDLHCNNIIVYPCERDRCIEYTVTNNGYNEIISVPTFGYLPVIIDYGFAYSQNIDNKPFYNTFSFYDSGFYIDKFDPICDYRLFLVSLADDFKNYGRDSKFNKFVRNMFGNMRVDWESGWYISRHASPCDILEKIMDLSHVGNTIISDSPFIFIDIFHSLITLPLQPQKYDKLPEAIGIFSREFTKISKEINDEDITIYIFRKMIDIASLVRADYLSGKNVTEKFERIFTGNILSVIKYFKMPKGVSFEKLLFSILYIARGMEGILYRLINIREVERIEQLSKAHEQNLLKIYKIFVETFNEDL